MENKQLNAEMETSIAQYEADLTEDGLEPETVQRKVERYRLALEAAQIKGRGEL